MCNCLRIDLPNCNNCLRPGDHIKLGRFDHETWVVSYGWYSWGGNRPVLGWYLVSLDRDNTLKPLQQTDLIDIYLIER